MVRTPMIVVLLLAVTAACSAALPPRRPTCAGGCDDGAAHHSGPEPDGEGRAEPALAGAPRRPAGPAEAADMVTAAQQVIRSDGSTRRPARRGRAHRPAGDPRDRGPRTWLPRVLDRWGRATGSGCATTSPRAASSARCTRARRPTSPMSSPPGGSWRPPRHRTLLRSYREAERRFGVDWEYLAAINLVETAFGRIRGTSVAGAQGPMQFIPTTWDIYGAGGDINDAHDAILAAGRLLRANGFARDKAAACGATTTPGPTSAASPCTRRSSSATRGSSAATSPGRSTT